MRRRCAGDARRPCTIYYLVLLFCNMLENVGNGWERVYTVHIYMYTHVCTCIYIYTYTYYVCDTM